MWLLASPGLVAVATPQPQVLPHHAEAYALDSGTHDAGAEEVVAAYRETIEVPGALWLRVHFGASELGAGSYVTVQSLADDGWQRLDAEMLPEWNFASAFFNGDAVEVTLYVAPGDTGVYVTIDELTVGDPDAGGEIVEAPTGGDGIASLCGGDNRTASGDAAVGRLFLLGGCTAWLISNGGVLTAGHCVDREPDGNGPLLPDGMLENGFVNGVVGFNVPASSANGVPVAPNPDNQYPVSTAYVAWQFPGSNANTTSVGVDWCIFTLGRNSNTGLRAHIAQNAFYRLSTSVPDNGQTVRVTGYGVDNTPAGTGGVGAACCDSDGDGNCENNCNANNLTLQTATGSFSGYSESGVRRRMDYAVDTMPANSGSPVIFGSRAVGIHTNGGCTAGGGANAGTSFRQTTLQQFVNDFPGVNTIYADAVSTCFPLCLGTVFTPHANIAQAAAQVPDGGVVSIVRGSYPAAAGNAVTLGANGKAMRLEAPVGTVTIGN